ncbi:MAG: Cna B-type domain-containing protein [Lachnospiraceae bacterium]|nr:Cna B-type domain-containing protein [Lachnospiraceae bacterium]
MHAIKRKWKLMSLVLTLIISFGMLIPNQVSAADKKGSITLKYPFENVTFHAYRVGEWDGSAGEFKLIEPYSKDNQITMLDLQGHGQKLAESLADIIEAGQYKADYNTTTKSENDKVTGVFKELPYGVYVVTGDTQQEDNGYAVTTRSATPSLVFIPGENDENSPLTEDITIDVKPMESQMDKAYDLSVYKLWSDKENQAKARPEKIQVGLYNKVTKKVEDKQTLSQANNWSYTWTQLSKKYVYSIIEYPENQDYYLTEVSYNKGAVTLTNTYIPHKEKNVSANPTNKVTPKKSGTKNTVAKKLPQTGQLWWPVPFLVCLGLISLIIGLVRKNKNRA